jgi:pyruvate-formate lyase-activating enzyme
MAGINEFSVCSVPPVQIRFLLFLYLCVLRDLFVQNPSLWAWCAILVALLKHPLVVPKPVNRPLYGLTNSQLGSPASLLH